VQERRQHGSASPQVGQPAWRLRDQPLLPLPPASSAGDEGSLSTRIQGVLPPGGDCTDLKRGYVRAVLGRYLWLPDTPSQTSRHDRRLAATLYERGVPLMALRVVVWVKSL